jgi:type I restriction enzyme S subunit
VSNYQLSINNYQLPEGYKQTEVGVIPEDWDVVELARLITAGPKNGYSGQAGGDAKGTPTLRLTATSSGYLVINNETVKHLNETINPRSELFLKSGDVLIQRSNTYELVGTTAVFDGPPNIYVYPDLMMRLRFSDSLTAHWFWKYANSTNGRRFFLSAAAGSTGSMPKISGAKLRQMPIPIPSTEERRAIATALSDVDALIAALDKLIAKKRHLKTATMQQLLTGKKRLPGFGEEWKIKQLGEVAEMGSGGTPPSSIGTYYGGNIPWVSISDMTKGGKVITSTERSLTEAGFSSSATQMFPSGTILYAMYASLGECSIAGIPLCSSQAILGIQPNKELDGGFLYYFLISLKMKVKTLGQQGTQSNLNKGMVQEFKLPLPCLPEQRAIATVLSDMDTEIAALETRRAKTQAIKQGMMQQLLTGKVRLVASA